jgi:hypothetical protein
MKFRKKPVVIEARQLTPNNAEDIGAWCGALKCTNGSYDSYLWGWALDVHDRTLRIPTLEGDHSASMGDWIIQGIKGEFYPCKPDIFEATYEKVE